MEKKVNDFNTKNGRYITKIVYRKRSETYNSIVNGIKNNSDPKYEFQVLARDYTYEAVASILVGEGEH